MGEININNTGSGSAITLSSDGTSLLLNGTAVGGGADLYTANESSPAAQPSATGANAIALGDSAVASGSKSIALGYKATATANFATAFAESRAAGEYSFAAGIANDSTTYGASGAYSISIGYQSRAKANQSVALGSSAYVDSDSNRGLSLGENAYVEQMDYGSAIGANARVHGSNSTTHATAIGTSYASGNHSFAAAITNNSSTYGAQTSNSIAMGKLAKVSSGTDAVAIGTNALATGGGAVSLGFQSDATGSSAVALGNGALASALFSTALPTSTASGNYSLAAGQSSTASHGNSISLGTNVQSTATNQINLGGTADTVRISETYTLPTTDGTNGQVLTTDGSGVVTFADAGGGGGGADLYAANESSPTAQPSATGTNAIAIGDSATATSTYSHSMGYGADATGQYATAIGYDALASGSRSVAIGDANSAGTASFAAGIANRSTSYGATANNSIAMGQLAKASGSQATAIGFSTLASHSGSLALGNDAHATDTNAVAIGKSAVASQNQSTAIGENNTASGVNSIAVGPYAGTASGNYSICISTDTSSATAAASVAIGDSAVSNIIGAIKFASGRFDISSRGQAQGGQFILRADTTDATATVLTTNNSTAAATNQIAAPVNDTCITFDGTITAMQNGAQAYASWKIEGLLVNDGGTTTLANSATTVISNGSSWGMALSADNTNNALAITCTGEASHNIRWVANIRTTEVTYA